MSGKCLEREVKSRGSVPRPKPVGLRSGPRPFPGIVYKKRCVPHKAPVVDPIIAEIEEQWLNEVLRVDDVIRESPVPISIPDKVYTNEDELVYLDDLYPSLCNQERLTYLDDQFPSLKNNDSLTFIKSESTIHYLDDLYPSLLNQEKLTYLDDIYPSLLNQEKLTYLDDQFPSLRKYNSCPHKDNESRIYPSLVKLPLKPQQTCLDEVFPALKDKSSHNIISQRMNHTDSTKLIAKKVESLIGNDFELSLKSFLAVKVE